MSITPPAMHNVNTVHTACGSATHSSLRNTAADPEETTIAAVRCGFSAEYSWMHAANCADGGVEVPTIAQTSCDKQMHNLSTGIPKYLRL